MAGRTILHENVVSDHPSVNLTFFFLNIAWCTMSRLFEWQDCKSNWFFTQSNNKNSQRSKWVVVTIWMFTLFLRLSSSYQLLPKIRKFLPSSPLNYHEQQRHYFRYHPEGSVGQYNRHWLAPAAAVIRGSVCRFSHSIQEQQEQQQGNNNPSSNNTAATTLSLIEEKRRENYENRKKFKAEAREKRRKRMMGLPKAIDRGQYKVTYEPLKVNNKFVARSGLPSQLEEFLQQKKQQQDDDGIVKRPYYVVLGIESSCDDTGAAIVDSYGNILSESLMKQNHIHEQWGGVVPGLAKQAHEEAIDFVVEEAVRKAPNIDSLQDVDAIGVTVGPGLEICLRVGCNKAKDIAMQYQKPFVAIHHLEAHILMARLLPQTKPEQRKQQQKQVEARKDTQQQQPAVAVKFPFLALLVSGGHCQILKCLDIGKYEVMGGTLDDSLGEAYDKTARLLGLPGVGGGPALEQLAKGGNMDSIPLCVPLQKRPRSDCNFSYAGLKTATRVATEKLLKQRQLEQQLHEQQRQLEQQQQQQQQQQQGNNDERNEGEEEENQQHKTLESIIDLPEKDKANIAASFQHTAIRHLEQRLDRAMDIIEKEEQIRAAENNNNNNLIRTLAVVGGVAANQQVRERLEQLCVKRNLKKRQQRKREQSVANDKENVAEENGNEEDDWKMIVPPPRLCTDQGTMSAWAAIERLNVGSSDDPQGQEVHARYPFANSQNSAK